MVARYRPWMRALVEAPAPKIVGAPQLGALARHGAGLLRLGRPALLELLRIAAQPAEDTLADHVPDERVRAGLVAPSLLGTWMGPLSPASTTTLLFDQAVATAPVAGGAPAWAEALTQAARSAGAELRCGTEVSGIEVEGGRVRGVRTAAGDLLDADVVVSCICPRRTLVELVVPWEVPPELVRAVQRIRARGIVGVVDLALAEPPCDPMPGRVVLTPGLHALERAFDAAKYGEVAERPALMAWFAPSQRGVVATVLAWAAPFARRGGWDDAAREALGAAVIGQLDAAFPGLAAGVRAHRVRSPADLAAQLGLPGGHLLHGELALDQVWGSRPTAALAAHRTPIEGLSLGSVGTHGGWGSSGVPGRLAARALQAS